MVTCYRMHAMAKITWLQVLPLTEMCEYTLIYTEVQYRLAGNGIICPSERPHSIAFVSQLWTVDGIRTNTTENS